AALTEAVFKCDRCGRRGTCDCRVHDTCANGVNRASFVPGTTKRDGGGRIRQNRSKSATIRAASGRAALQKHGVPLTGPSAQYKNRQFLSSSFCVCVSPTPGARSRSTRHRG